MKDPLLSQIVRLCHIGWPVRDTFKDNPAIHVFFKVKDSLSIQNNCLFFAARIVIPIKLQAQVLKVLHEGHPGIVRSKPSARSTVWWPALNSDVETMPEFQ